MFIVILHVHVSPCNINYQVSRRKMITPLDLFWYFGASDKQDSIKDMLEIDHKLHVLKKKKEMRLRVIIKLQCQ